MLADYALQTNWVAARKSQSLSGLVLHGFIVFAMSLLVLARYLNVLFVPLIVMGLLHTGQDWLKVYAGKRLKFHPFYPYIADQVLHYVAIFVLELVVGSWLTPPPTRAEYTLMALGVVALAATRFYDVTWWANWLDMMPFMNRWQWWGYAERLAMVALTAVGGWFVAPLCVIPRLIYASYIKRPIAREKRGLLETVVGIGFSIVLGLIVRGLLAV